MGHIANADTASGISGRFYISVLKESVCVSVPDGRIAFVAAVWRDVEARGLGLEPIEQVAIQCALDGNRGLWPQIWDAVESRWPGGEREDTRFAALEWSRRAAQMRRQMEDERSTDPIFLHNRAVLGDAYQPPEITDDMIEDRLGPRP